MLTVGEILKKQRENQGRSLSQIEKELKIREKFLEAIEKNEWDSFSSKVYVAGVIKAYAKLLDLNHDKLTAFFRREYEKKEKVEFKTRIASKYLTPHTKRIMFLLLVLIFAAFTTYFGYQLKLYFSPPKVVILSSYKNPIINEDKIKIKGKTEKEAMITIFGERIYQNKDGQFEYDFPLKSGSNQLKIEVVGANGRKTVISREYIKKQI